MGRSGRLLALYVLGILLVGAWSLGQVLGGTVTTENAARVIVFPLAWTFGYWPTVLPLAMAVRIWGLQSTLERYAERRAAGVSTAEPEAELVDTLTRLAAEENGIPDRVVRPFVRRFLRSASTASAPTAR